MNYISEFFNLFNMLSLHILAENYIRSKTTFFSTFMFKLTTFTTIILSLNHSKACYVA